MVMRQYSPSRPRIGVLFLAILMFVGHAHAQIHVKHDASGTNDGTSWDNAFTDLQSALAIASAPDEIWVAAGTYRPDSTADRTATFQLISSVSVYGGFGGTEVLLQERNLSLVTTLSGDIGIADDPSDNSYHVVTGSGTDSTAVLDGFTVTGGNADGAGDNRFGGGIINQDGRPTLRNLFFLDNAAANGGAIFNGTNADGIITNVLCMGNSATSGGAISNLSDSDPILTNVTLIDNSATIGGGGISNSYSSPTIVNCLLWLNTASIGSQIRSPGPASPVISYSYVEGSGGSGAGWDVEIGIDGGNNVDGDPVWMLVADDDWRMTNLSPMFNSGDNGAPLLAQTDILGNPRIFDGTVDMGALELVCAAGPVVYADVGAVGPGNGSTWVDAYANLREALMSVCASANEVWVAEGVYTPTAGTDRQQRFLVRGGLGLYGGFDGSEVTRGQRDPPIHPTVLSGEIGGPENTDNTANVLRTLSPDAGTIIDGFTITRSYDSSGATVTHATLSNVIVTDNHHPGGEAGGLRIYGQANIVDATISNNSADAAGGAWCTDTSDPSFLGVSFTDNSARIVGGVYLQRGDGASFEDTFFMNNSGDWAGAIQCIAVDSLRVDNATFIGHTGGYKGGAVRVHLSDGVTIRNTTFDSNSATLGGAVYGDASEIVFTNVFFFDNTANLGGGMYFGILSATPFTACDIEIFGGVFRGNSASAGGGLYNGWSDVHVVNSTFYDNSADTTGGAILTDVRNNWVTDWLTVTNSILWGNHALSGKEIYNRDPTEPLALVSYSLIENSGGSGAPWDTLVGQDLGNNIDADPLFVAPGAGDFRLLGGSPAIDAGDPAVPGLPSEDAAGNPRITGTTIDMGAYEHGPTTAIADPAPSAPTSSSLQAVYPNPFNPSVTVVFSLDRERHVTVTVFDATGRKVRTLFDGAKPGGEHRLQWDAGSGVASGVYFLRIESGAWSATRKIVLVK